MGGISLSVEPTRGARRAPAARAKRGRGQFFTPLPVVEFMLDALALWGALPPPGARILDPACGEGVFLRRARERGIAGSEALYGLDLDPAARDWWRAADLDRWPHLHVYDGLRDDPDLGIERGAFDLVIGNPPYGYDLTPDASFAAWMLVGSGARCPVEVLFLERFVQLARPGGTIAVILPEGLLVNTRLQAFRDWLLDQVWPQAIVSLPRATFGAAGAHAKTAVLFARKRPAPAPPDGVLLVAPEQAHARRAALTPYLKMALGARRSALGGTDAGRPATAEPSTEHRAPSAALQGHPWSPEYWDGAAAAALARLRGGPLPLHPLGELDAAGREVGFIRFTTYGAVGARHFTPSGVRYLSPRNLTPTGIDVSLRERFVAAGGPNDPPRSRLREGDILLSNSGVASVGRTALFWGFRGDYTVAQHINRIQVAGIDPFYVTAYLHTSFARAQLRRFQSGTGAAGISFAQIRALQIPVPPAAVQAAVRCDYEAMHAVHLEAMAARDEPRRQAEARALLADLVRRLEAYLLDPDGAGFG